MSDKTKWVADQQAIRQRLVTWYRREREKPKFDPHCWCGAPGPIHIFENALRSYYVCGRHLPDEWR